VNINMTGPDPDNDDEPWGGGDEDGNGTTGNPADPDADPEF
jgi:hypothetical protein